MERLTMRNRDGSYSQPTHTTFEAMFNRLAEFEDFMEDYNIKDLRELRKLVLDCELLKKSKCDFSKCELMGARKFIDMPKGTIFQEIWENDEDSLYGFIEKFKNNDLQVYWDEVYIYWNNSCSADMDEGLFRKDDDGDVLFTDINVVGDANPPSTLYLVFNEEIVPDYILNVRDEILKDCDSIDNIKDKHNEWARNFLEENYKNDDIVNFYLKGEC